jgi:hypothetical protein
MRSWRRREIKEQFRHPHVLERELSVRKMSPSWRVVLTRPRKKPYFCWTKDSDIENGLSESIIWPLMLALKVPLPNVWNSWKSQHKARSFPRWKRECATDNLRVQLAAVVMKCQRWSPRRGRIIETPSKLSCSAHRCRRTEKCCRADGRSRSQLRWVPRSYSRSTSTSTSTSMRLT